MTYATRADLDARFGPGEMDKFLDGGEGRIDAALADANAEIEASLGVAYALPLPEGDFPVLRSIACDLARLQLYDDAPTDAVTDRARRARALLKDMAAGGTALLQADGRPVPRQSPAPQASGPTPIMTEDALAGLR